MSLMKTAQTKGWAVEANGTRSRPLTKEAQAERMATKLRSGKGRFAPVAAKVVAL